MTVKKRFVKEGDLKDISMCKPGKYTLYNRAGKETGCLELEIKIETGEVRITFRFGGAIHFPCCVKCDIKSRYVRENETMELKSVRVYKDWIGDINYWILLEPLPESIMQPDEAKCEEAEE